jgi:hypothetical protein
MAVVNVKSIIVSNYDAQPRVLTSGYIAGSNDTTSTAIVACGASDSATSVYRAMYIPSGVLLSDLAIMNDANTGGTSYKFGVAFNTQDGGALPVANSDLIFASTITMASARNVWTNILNPSILNAGGLPANVNLRVWELLGLAADPFKEYHLIMTAVTAGTGGGNVAIRANWLR